MFIPVSINAPPSASFPLNRSHILQIYRLNPLKNYDVLQAYRGYKD